MSRVGFWLGGMVGGWMWVDVYVVGAKAGFALGSLAE